MKINSSYITVSENGKKNISSFSGKKIITNVIVTNTVLEAKRDYLTNFDIVPVYIDLFYKLIGGKRHYLCYKKLVDTGDALDLLPDNFNAFVDAGQNDLIINVYSQSHTRTTGNVCVTVNYESI